MSIRLPTIVGVPVLLLVGASIGYVLHTQIDDGLNAIGVQTSPEMAAQSILQTSVYDPESLRLRDVVQNSPGVYCGWLNAKNRVGGYVGFRRFVIWQGSPRIDPGDDVPYGGDALDQYNRAKDQFNNSWSSMCEPGAE